MLLEYRPSVLVIDLGVVCICYGLLHFMLQRRVDRHDQTKKLVSGSGAKNHFHDVAVELLLRLAALWNFLLVSVH